MPRPGVDLLLTDEDLEDLLEYLALEEERCSGCAQPKSESFSPAFQDDWVAKPLRCHACAAREQAAARFGPDDARGLYFAVARDAST